MTRVPFVARRSAFSSKRGLHSGFLGPNESEMAAFERL